MTEAITRISAADTAATVAEVLVPLAARGLIVRRPRMTGALAALDADRRAIQRLQALRDRYGAGPALLALPGRRLAVILAGADARAVLERSPDPFATATPEKRAALSRFQPHGVLISDAASRPPRRELNERALQPQQAIHRHGERFAAVIAQETEALLAAARHAGRLDYEMFADAWGRLVRRIVLGDGAAGDEQLSLQLAQLRADANWAYLKPRRERLRERFLEAVGRYVERAQEGSLVAALAAAPAPPGSAPAEQVPQWLFAFDAAAIASFRALAVLAARPAVAAAVTPEVEQEPADGAVPELPLLRALVLESVRLWPTTPAILRETTADAALGEESAGAALGEGSAGAVLGEETVDAGLRDGTSSAGGRAVTVPAGTGILIFTPFFHRDPAHVPAADEALLERWPGGEVGDSGAWPLMPFSLGPAQCPGRSVVLLTTSLALRALLRAARFSAVGSPLHGERPLPATLSPFSLSFVPEPR